MKFQLSTLLLTVTCIALATGWLYERRTYKSNLSNAIETERSVRTDIMNASMWTNISHYRQQSELKFDRLKTEMLATAVVECWLILDNIDDKLICDEFDRSSLEHCTSSALSQLKIADTTSFKNLLASIHWEQPQFNWDIDHAVVLINNDGSMNSDLIKFLDHRLVQ